MQMSDEALLKRLNSHPELRGRVEPMLLVVDDEMGNLQEADAAELRLIEEMRRMGQESLQARADSQVSKTAERAAQVRHTWREGKKTPVAQHLRRACRRRAAIPVRHPAHPAFRGQRQGEPSRMLAPPATRGDRLRSRCRLCPSDGQTGRTLRDTHRGKHHPANNRNTRPKHVRDTPD